MGVCHKGEGEGRCKHEKGQGVGCGEGLAGLTSAIGSGCASAEAAWRATEASITSVASVASITTTEAFATPLLVGKPARCTAVARALLPIVANSAAATSAATVPTTTTEVAATAAAATAAVIMRKPAGGATHALSLLPIVAYTSWPPPHATAATESATVSGATEAAAATTTATTTSIINRDSTAHLLGPLLALALIIDLDELHRSSLLEGIAILDVGEVAEQILTTIFRGDETEATIGPAAHRTLNSLTSTDLGHRDVFSGSWLRRQLPY